MLDTPSSAGAKGAESLGAMLKAARLRQGLSLRAVEAATGISNGYLSQLESDAVRTPSPRHLYQLAEVYGVAYATLMSAADYPVPVPASTPAAGAATAALPSGLVFAAGYLTPEDEQKVRGYIDALRAQYASRRPTPPDSAADPEG